MSIIRLGRFVPKNLREWDVVFRNINKVIQETPSGVSVTADNLPPQDAAYVTLSNNASLENDRALTSKAGETVVTDSGPGSSVTIGLVDKGTAGTYAKVVTDKKGRVVAGADLTRADMPAPLNRMYSGTGTPNGVVSATPGSLYLNIAGGSNQTLWIKESGSSNTGWASK